MNLICLMVQDGGERTLFLDFQFLYYQVPLKLDKNRHFFFEVSNCQIFLISLLVEKLEISNELIIVLNASARVH